MKLFCAALDWIVSFISRGTNALWFGNSWHRTLSAEAHWQAAMGDAQWAKRRDRIDRLFSWREPDHCQKAWAQELYRANRTLDMDRQINDP
ncbi:hypothetical protein [uncultured Roseobacter sp.]|uniref:hypothetical protein n=1 Tax=uncultured Roseobacter sp. TaxID=114847 RepID=UPI0026097273|nr:hypothetical protein [uncultured Roseobacter sp.]